MKTHRSSTNWSWLFTKLLLKSWIIYSNTGRWPTFVIFIRCSCIKKKELTGHDLNELYRMVFAKVCWRRWGCEYNCYKDALSLKLLRQEYSIVCIWLFFYKRFRWPSKTFECSSLKPTARLVWSGFDKSPFVIYVRGKRIQRATERR